MKETWGKILGVAQNESVTEEENQLILAELIESNPYQPRKIFDPIKIDELAQSIKTYGLIQPIVVRRYKKKYQLIAGERRLMACKKLGWTRISAIVKDYNESAMAAVALIENLQRENLNFMEEAEALERLFNEFGLTQEVLAQRLGKSQSTIANKLRLLKLPEKVKQIFKESNLTERHARALLRIPEENKQLDIISKIIEKELNVKQTDEVVQAIVDNGKGKTKTRTSKVVIRDLRIFLNTLKQAVQVIEKAGLKPKVTEEDLGDYYEVKIWLPKKNN